MQAITIVLITMIQRWWWWRWWWSCHNTTNNNNNTNNTTEKTTTIIITTFNNNNNNNNNNHNNADNDDDIIATVTDPLNHSPTNGDSQPHSTRTPWIFTKSRKCLPSVGFHSISRDGRSTTDDHPSIKGGWLKYSRARWHVYPDRRVGGARNGWSYINDKLYDDLIILNYY